jgi:hypothetical protein
VRGMASINFARLMTRRWVALVLCVLAIEWVLLLGPLAFPVSEGEAVTAWNRAYGLLGWQLRQSIPVQIPLVFLNNLRAAFVFLIPGLGWISFPLSMASEGQLVAGIAAFTGTPPLTEALVVLPKADAWLELAAYACAFVESFYFAYYVFRGKPGESLWKIATAFVLVVMALSVAAVAETVSIASGNLGPEISLVLVLGLSAGIYMVIKKVWPESLSYAPTSAGVIVS